MGERNPEPDHGGGANVRSVSGLARSGQFLLGVGAMAVAPVVGGILAYRGTGAIGRGELATYVVSATIAAIVAARGIDAALLSHNVVTAPQAELWPLVNRRLAMVAVMEAPVAAAAAGLLIGRFDAAGTVATWLLTLALTDYVLSKALAVRARSTGTVLVIDVSIAVTSIVLSSLVYGTDGPATAYVWAVAAPIVLVLMIARVVSPRRRVFRLGSGSAGVALIYRRAIPLFLSKGLLVTAFRLDRVILVSLAGLGVAGVYAAAIPLAELVGLAPLHLAQISTVELSTEPQRPWWRPVPAMLGIAISGLLTFVVLLGAVPILEFAYDDASAELVRTARILAVASFISGLWRLAESELVARGRSRLTVPPAGCAALVVVVVTVVFAVRWESTAAAVGSLIGYSFALVITLAFSRRERVRAGDRECP
jgi:O-antigen/teichoic acid export membrane protein